MRTAADILSDKAKDLEIDFEGWEPQRFWLAHNCYVETQFNHLAMRKYMARLCVNGEVMAVVDRDEWIGYLNIRRPDKKPVHVLLHATYSPSGTTVVMQADFNPAAATDDVARILINDKSVAVFNKAELEEFLGKETDVPNS